MKLVILYRPNSEHDTSVNNYVNSITELSPDAQIDLIDGDSQDGLFKMQTYGLMQLPAIFVVTETGEMIDAWQGQSLPPVEQVIKDLNR